MTEERKEMSVALNNFDPTERYNPEIMKCLKDMDSKAAGYMLRGNHPAIKIAEAIAQGKVAIVKIEDWNDICEVISTETAGFIDEIDTLNLGIEECE